MSGSVTNPTGSVGGKNLSGLVDAETVFAGSTAPVGGQMAQWQSGAVLTDKPGVCSRLVNGMQTYLANEMTLQIVVTGWKPYADGADNNAPWAPPAADLPLTLPVTPDTTGSDGSTDSGGVHRIAQAHVMQASKTGRAGNNIDATGGSITITAVDDADPDRGQSGSYDIAFGTERVTGSYVAPVC